MARMTVQADCYPCLQGLVELTVELATLDPQVQDQARRQAREIIDREFLPGAIPAIIANQFHQVIKDLSGNPDPFAARKASETEFMQRLAAEIVPRRGEDLVSRIGLAVAGNAIDFFRSGEEITRELENPVALVHSDLDIFQARLTARPGVLLYLADNAGEQFFDLPLVQAIRRQGWRVIYVVKGGPIQNDLTRADLYASGLGPAMEPVEDSGPPMVGLVLAKASPEFRQRFADADLILAKGMGHFETLAHLDDPRIFFLLQAKCRPIAAALGVPPLSLVLKALSSLP